MTARQIYQAASAFLYERDKEDAENERFAVPFLNVLLQEALPTENSIRRYDGRAELASAPAIESLEEEIGYADPITRIAFPYGLASFFFQESLNNFQAENYRAKYISALGEARKYTPEPIVNAYE